jgi:FG-GAP-like repeat/HYDIN/CFA65/VesB-like, Ig-like domain/FG-GAP repeat
MPRISGSVVSEAVSQSRLSSPGCGQRPDLVQMKGLRKVEGLAGPCRIPKLRPTQEELTMLRCALRALLLGAILISAAGRLAAGSLFFPPANYVVAGGPLAIAAGDFNGDGTPDLATVDGSTGNCVTVLLGNGDGSFQAPLTYPVGANPLGVQAGDFNGDGRLDLAVANADSNSIGILLGNGDGTFQPMVSYPVVGSGYPISIAVADFNRDSKLDIVAADANGGIGNHGGVNVLLGNGDGTFQSAASYAAGTEPVFVAVGDFNNDGAPDLAVANYYGSSGSTLSILLGDGNGEFAAAVNYSGGAAPRSLAVGDFNMDGNVDLAVADAGLRQKVSILLGNGDGTFSSRTTLAAGTDAWSIVTADFNKDGNPDLAVGSISMTAPPVVLLGNGDGTFLAPLDVDSANPSAYALLAADLNGDGLPDLAVPNSVGQAVTVLLNAGPTPCATLSATSVGFGAIPVGQVSGVMNVKLTNTGTLLLTVTSVTLGGMAPGNFKARSTCGTVGIGASCSIGLEFTPHAKGNARATVMIADNAPGSPQTITLTGTGE